MVAMGFDTGNMSALSWIVQKESHRQAVNLLLFGSYPSRWLRDYTTDFGVVSNGGKWLAVQ
jgi:hypothetical protein